MTERGNFEHGTTHLIDRERAARSQFEAERETLRQIRSRRISVLVCVPKILDVLREHILRVLPEAADAPTEQSHVAIRWWRYRRIHQLLGFKFWAFVVGAAPLDPKLEEFWSQLAFVVVQGYGLTETAPIVTLNHPFRTHRGTVGTPIGGVEVRIASDGEVLVRGPNVTSGYYNAPTQTAAVFEDGWFHTGDIGRIDEDGFLKITDRKKNIIVLSNGKNVAPQPIESQLLRSEYISQLMLIGDKQKSIAALVVPNFDALKEYGKKQNLETENVAILVEAKEIRQLVRDEINRLVADFADFERPKMFTVINREFTQEQDEMTPTLKLKRRVILEHFSDEIKGMYGGESAD